MKSLSYDLLRMASDPSRRHAGTSSLDGEESLRDDSIPLHVQRHLAHFLASVSSPYIEPSHLLTHFKSSLYVNQKRKILKRTAIHLRPRTLSDPDAPFSSAPSTPNGNGRSGRKFGLQTLPAELLGMISHYLRPSDLICLGLSSRDMFHGTNYQLTDLRNLSFAAELSDLLHDHRLSRALGKQAWQVRCSLARDRIQRLEWPLLWRGRCGHGSSLGETASEMDGLLACAVCARLHPRHFFSRAEQDRPAAQGRRCLASLAEVRICEHWAVSLFSLLEARERGICDLAVDSDTAGQRWFRIVRCKHCHHREGGDVKFEAPQMMDVGGYWNVERTVRLGCFENMSGKEITAELVCEILRQRELTDFEICPHVRLGDNVVVEAFNRTRKISLQDFPAAFHSTVTYLPQFESASCEHCEKSWQFCISNHVARECGAPLVARLKLTIDERIPSTKDPWTIDYLKKVEGGEELMQLMAKASR